MARGKSHPEETKALAIQRYLAGESPSRIARDLGVTRFTVASWIKTHDPAHRPMPPAQYRRNVEELGSLVYDTVVETLNAIRTRAIETGRPEWIKTQSAADIAALDTAQWDRIIRVISAFRPAADQADDSDGHTDEQPGVYRNGAVDSAD